eukprot:m.77632 g.77632  ORF g.77632 m.77632 type:complete len:192 (-) comp14477_c0_seq1:3318-3893(-)
MSAFLEALVVAIDRFLTVVGHCFSLLTFTTFVVSSRIVYVVNLCLLGVALLLTVPVWYMMTTVQKMAKSANNTFVELISEDDDERDWLWPTTLPDYEGGMGSGFVYLFQTIALPFSFIFFLFIALIPVLEIAVFLPMLLVTLLFHIRYYKIKKAFSEVDRSSDTPEEVYGSIRSAIFTASCQICFLCLLSF